MLMAKKTKVKSGVEYVGDEPSGVRVGDRQILKGDVISGPPDLVEYLAKRHGFKAVKGDDNGTN